LNGYRDKYSVCRVILTITTMKNKMEKNKNKKNEERKIRLRTVQGREQTFLEFVLEYN